MTDYFVGKGGNDGNTGLSWAQRFLTLNAAEDEPVASGDTVYVGPGVYREMLTVDIDGASMITYIGDVTGENTDNVGGVVRITGSDNDQTAARTHCIYASNKDYRTFQGFAFDMATTAQVELDSGCDHWVITDCSCAENPTTSDYGIHCNGSYDTITIKRCIFRINESQIYISNAGDQSATDFVIEDCLFTHGASSTYGVLTSNVDSIVIKNCTFDGLFSGIRTLSLAVATVITVYNCILSRCDYGLYAADADDITEDYCVYSQNGVDFQGDVIGANSETYPILFEPPILYEGSMFPWLPFNLSEWSQVARITGTGETTTDLFGITKPTTASKSSWGAIQYWPIERETGTTRGASTASIGFADAGEHQIWVPVEAVEITVTVYCYREANYAGTNPRMVIKEPGVADQTTTDGAAASQWNLLTDTITPTGNTDYIVVCLQSLNTAVAGNFAAFFDDFDVS